MSDEERLKQIRERRGALQLRHGDWPCQTVHNSKERAFQQYVLADIDFLLSLLDSQAKGAGVSLRMAGLGVQNKMGCWCVTPFVNISEDRDHEPRCKAMLAALREPDGATAMRDKCVEKVKEVRRRIEAAAKAVAAGSPEMDDYNGQYAGATKALNAIESLTLDQVEQEKQ